ncbi:hypothetical protein K3N28_00775 [Glycomyces sp. TRM65418]|uniref:hypothetical protein n=1 Tax=Glycomyces sp. TRM65418 TaxID=2867006 RepID=UPI001CE5EAF9|nr:hypothetical protein [Glycomyces sp. TRM65418]MCC3761608.1 hypothetical protein [Glycomyces sp. TRM65418]QZD55704.1 hypothetical protein K3N28_00765 [Glycomyces sp. TRM65418]
MTDPFSAAVHVVAAFVALAAAVFAGWSARGARKAAEAALDGKSRDVRVGPWKVCYVDGITWRFQNLGDENYCALTVYAWRSGDDFIDVEEAPHTEPEDLIEPGHGRELDLSDELADGGTYFIATWATHPESTELAGRYGFRLPMG